jgi:hypothetical protein
MALGTLATIALGVSAASGIANVVDARKARKEQTARLNQQRIEAKEAASRREVQEDTGADILLGTDQGTTTTGTAQKRRTPKRTSVLGTAGGLGTASRIGL